ncbi:MAG TPA: hypothetical protein VFV51_11295 [Vicinamibacterales bacterium]|nr:hypothetical protein [Vicinamibacterales bacterium]
MIGAATVLGFITLLAMPFDLQAQDKTIELYDGLDPVELLAGREVPGDDSLTVDHAGYRFLFANAANRSVFEKDPARYEPANGGTCARMGPLTMGVPALFAVHEGRIYLFGSGDCRKAFTAAPARYLASSTSALVATPDARARGRALAQSLGEAVGANTLRAATAYQQTSRTERSGPNGLVISEERLLVRWPADLRLERDLPFGTVISATSGADAFSVLMRKAGAPIDDTRAIPARAALAAALRERAGLAVLSVIKAFVSPGADVVATDVPPGADPSLAYARLRHAGTDVTLGLDKSTSRPRVIVYRGRASDGAYALITLGLDEYRQTSGMWLPHVVTGTADGIADPALSLRITGWQLDPVISNETFSRPTVTAVPKQ